MGGKYACKGNTYAAKRALVSEAAYASKFIKGAGNVLGYGLILTGADMVNNGITTINSLDAAIGVISFAPGWGWIVGGIYFIGNAALKETTGKDLGEHIDDWAK